MTTAHAEAYQRAWQSSRTADLRSLSAHWQAGYTFQEYGDRAVDIAEDVGVSVATIYHHIQLYTAFPTINALVRAAQKAGHFNYQLLAREALGLPTNASRPARFFRCARCHSTELERVLENESV